MDDLGGHSTLYIQKRLKQSIIQKRLEMIQLAFDKGFTSTETVKSSQELDYLLNLYREISLKSVA
ncbi:aspartyl-phosphate phosphatase Spo0E family protein [Lentibacillus jeotgali]|uniref:aspartyl-phosphate phosphatase Spo0E family protein n=1 Tax=Lentibacillus jeotgali TaxID=558169 RepID=UPI00110FA507|nr:aspartyl-phosphate phosphatase Spo0E family protein [Lentibacillus jeotgali]